MLNKELSSLSHFLFGKSRLFPVGFTMWPLPHQKSKNDSATCLFCESGKWDFGSNSHTPLESDICTINKTNLCTIVYKIC